MHKHGTAFAQIVKSPDHGTGLASLFDAGFWCPAFAGAVTPRYPLLPSQTARKLGPFTVTALYGFGANEELVGRVLSAHRSRFTLASKCGMFGIPIDGQTRRIIDARPETLKRNCEESLRRLHTDVIDLFYLHRRDRAVPIEASVGGLADLIRAGKIRAIGLSEVSAATLRRAHAEHPIAAVQSEYSLMTRNPEIAVLEACRELGASFVAFGPLSRGFLTGKLRDVAGFSAKDIR